MEISDVFKKYSRRKVKLNIRTLDDDYILLEGSESSLKFLGELLIAQAEFKKDCGYQMAPNGAGSRWFDEKSERGIYIHRLPCLDKQKRGK
ncbi:MAG TPA: hypothetical protein VHP30_13240 [Ignavibacteriales bacterium]|nr:hypothetical protein [Ignavibacteriales bacterium]